MKPGLLAGVDIKTLSPGSRIACGQYQLKGKPFSYPELVARLHVHLRRAYAPGLGSTLRIGSLTIDRTARRACVEGRPVWLTPKEYALLVRQRSERRLGRAAGQSLRQPSHGKCW